MNILDEIDDFMNQTCIVKRNKKSHSMSKWFCRENPTMKLKNY